MSSSLLTQTLLQRERKKSASHQVEKARFFVGPKEAQLSFWPACKQAWRQRLAARKGFPLRHYRLGKSRLVMV